MVDAKNHWENIYSTKASDAVSWYRPRLETSLSLIRRVAEEKSSIIDVGAGSSTLADDLLNSGYRDITALDISEAALESVKQRIEPIAQQVQWIAADITSYSLPTKAYDVWHDRAVFHFLTQKEQRVAYIRNLLNAMKNGGHVIISTFASDGPQKCSGLDVVRYDAESLQKELGPQFRLVESLREVHNTPFGTTQDFIYCLFALKS